MLCCIRGGSRIPCKMGSRSSRGHHRTILSNFPKKLQEIENILAIRGSRAGGAPLDLPLCAVLLLQY